MQFSFHSLQDQVKSPKLLLRSPMKVVQALPASFTVTIQFYDWSLTHKVLSIQSNFKDVTKILKKSKNELGRDIDLWKISGFGYHESMTEAPIVLEYLRLFYSRNEKCTQFIDLLKSELKVYDIRVESRNENIAKYFFHLDWVIERIKTELEKECAFQANLNSIACTAISFIYKL